MDICRQKKPPNYQIDAEHSVACFLYEKDGSANPQKETGQQ
jgi:hypothetical protein